MSDRIIPSVSAEDIEKIRIADEKRRKKQHGKKGWWDLSKKGEIVVDVPKYVNLPKNAGQPNSKSGFELGAVASGTVKKPER